MDACAFPTRVSDADVNYLLVVVRWRDRLRAGGIRPCARARFDGRVAFRFVAWSREPVRMAGAASCHAKLEEERMLPLAPALAARINKRRRPRVGKHSKQRNARSESFRGVPLVLMI